MNPRLTVIHLARKPLIGTVALNALKHGTGGLNIDGCRIGVGDDASLLRTRKPQDNGGSMRPGEWQGGTTGSTNGRWPANLVLQHIEGPEGCRQVGDKKVRSQNPKYASAYKGATGLGFGIGPRPQNVGIGHADADGTETVPNWECVEGCPVKDLDEQSGSTFSSGGRNIRSHTSHIYGGGKGFGLQIDPEAARGDSGYGDTGGASRYFKQVRGDE